MSVNWRRKKTGWKKWILIALVFISLILSFRFPIVGETVRVAFHTVAAPVESSLSQIGRSLSNGFSSVGHVFQVKEENEELKQENQRLKTQLLRSQEVISENERLQELLQFKKERTDLSLYPTRVVGRSGNYQHFFIILKEGTEAGIQKEMPVLDGRGLVGIVRESWDGGSKVQLISDVDFAVGALVRRSGSRVTGVLEGNLDHPSTPRFINLPSDADIVVGDEIITSGLGGLYPKGLLIGQVISIHKDEGGLLKAAWIDPTAQIQRVEEVFVLKGFLAAGGAK